MPNQGMIALTKDRARDCRAVADIELDASESLVRFMNACNIGRVEDADAAGVQTVTNCGSPNRVLQAEGLELDATHVKWPAYVDHNSVRTGAYVLPAFRGRKYRTGGAMLQSPAWSGCAWVTTIAFGF